MAATTGKRTRKGASAPANKRAQEHRARVERKRNQRIWQTVLAVAIVGGLVALLLLALLQPRPGEYVPSQGNAHITEGQMGQFVYSTYPPTSGPHLSALASWGVHNESIPNELQVHNLEDGGVIVHYNCPDGCAELVAQLETIASRYHEGVILEPYPGMDTRIALTAWQRIDRLDSFDEQRIARFIRAYQGGDHHR
jgi:hypothetical protein